ncbi:MAG: hypothetical protein EA377_13075 [Phycisphaerales bacterium]|nr:MAG: hypothetical protein EA377_13075 [Phycisphaerales bacterium]
MMQPTQEITRTINLVMAATVALIALLLTGNTASYADGQVDTFTIGFDEIVSDGVPGLGAGNIERPGAMDLYTLNVTEATTVFFDHMNSSCAIRWTAEAPDGSFLFSNQAMCSGHPGLRELDQLGEYTITVFGNQNATGTYSFKVWSVPEPDTFTITLDQVISLNDPGPGAGNIEQPGAVDIYTLSIAEPLTVFFDHKNSSCGIRWSVQRPDGTMIFSNNAMCSGHPGVRELDQAGVYTISVVGNQTVTGTYSFKVWTVPPPDQFVINVDETVSPDNPGPGAGNIEQPGSRDEYTLSITRPTLVYFDEIYGPCNLRWSCEAPDGTLLFSNNVLCSNDPGEFLLDQTGDYLITVSAASNSTATGTYSVAVLTVENADEFVIELEDVVSDGVPGPGAGNIEQPGSIDRYTLSINTPTLVFFDELAGPCNIQWRCIAPDGSLLFNNDVMCSNDPGLRMLDQMGDYIIEVYGNQSATGTYSFTIWDVGEPDEFVIDFDQVVSDGVPGPGAGNIEKPGRVDLYELTITQPAIACVETFGIGFICSMRWSVEAPDGEQIVANKPWCDSTGNRVDLDEPGTYIFAFNANNDFTGAYSFVINTGKAADFNGDCVVNIFDLLALLENWGTCADQENCPADLNDDGVVNVFDLLILLESWG